MVSRSQSHAKVDKMKLLQLPGRAHRRQHRDKKKSGGIAAHANALLDVISRDP